MKDYTRIACAAYDVLEAASLRNATLRFTMVTGEKITATVKDVFAKGQEEFCIMIDENGHERSPIRLDAIAYVTDPTTGKDYTANAC